MKLMEPTDTSLKQTGEPAFSPDQFANDLREAMTSWNRAKLIEAQAHAKTMQFIESMDAFLKGGVK
jgi:hypothetical protein